MGWDPNEVDLDKGPQDPDASPNGADQALVRLGPPGLVEAADGVGAVDENEKVCVGARKTLQTLSSELEGHSHRPKLADVIATVPQGAYRLRASPTVEDFVNKVGPGPTGSRVALSRAVSEGKETIRRGGGDCLNPESLSGGLLLLGAFARATQTFDRGPGEGEEPEGRPPHNPVDGRGKAGGREEGAEVSTALYQHFRVEDAQSQHGVPPTAGREVEGRTREGEKGGGPEVVSAEGVGGQVGEGTATPTWEGGYLTSGVRGGGVGGRGVRV